MEKPAEPDALAFSGFADAVHPVVPVAGAEQGQAVAAERQAAIEGPGAVLEQRRALLAGRRLIEGLGLGGRERRSFEKADRLVENGGIAADLDIMPDRIGQPDPVVGNPRADSMAGGWQ